MRCKYRVRCVDGEGGVHFETLPLPYEAAQLFARNARRTYDSSHYEIVPVSDEPATVLATWEGSWVDLGGEG